MNLRVDLTEYVQIFLPMILGTKIERQIQLLQNMQDIGKLIQDAKKLIQNKAFKMYFVQCAF